MGSEDLTDCFGNPLTEALDWSMLPAELKYLVGPAVKFGGLQFEADRKRFWRQMTPQQRQELEQLANRFESAVDCQTVNAWMDGKSSVEHPEVARIYWRIHWLRAVVYEFQRKYKPRPPDPDGLDFSKVPRRISYLNMHAREYGKCQREEDKVRFMSDLGYKHGKLLGEQLNCTKDRMLVARWLEQYPPEVHREAALIRGFIALLDDYFPPSSFGPYGSN